MVSQAEPHPLIPAQAGIHSFVTLGRRLRGDEREPIGGSLNRSRQVFEGSSMKTTRREAVGLMLAAPMVLAQRPAFAQERLRIGKSVPNSWAFSASDVGVQTGIFKKEGI